MSFTALAGANTSLRAAAISIASPVAGFLPCRAGVSFTLNWPNPDKATESPPFAAVVMAETSASTALRACVFSRPACVA